jgi:hypothetical protein
MPLPPPINSAAIGAPALVMTKLASTEKRLHAKADVGEREVNATSGDGTCARMVL